MPGDLSTESPGLPPPLILVLESINDLIPQGSGPLLSSPLPPSLPGPHPEERESWIWSWLSGLEKTSVEMPPAHCPKPMQ